MTFGNLFFIKYTLKQLFIIVTVNEFALIIELNKFISGFFNKEQ